MRRNVPTIRSHGSDAGTGDSGAGRRGRKPTISHRTAFGRLRRERCLADSGTDFAQEEPAVPAHANVASLTLTRRYSARPPSGRSQSGHSPGNLYCALSALAQLPRRGPYAGNATHAFIVRRSRRIRRSTPQSLQEPSSTRNTARCDGNISLTNSKTPREKFTGGSF